MFKVGDKVRVVASSWYGRHGEVVGLREHSFNVRVRLDQREKKEFYFHESELGLVKSPDSQGARLTHTFCTKPTPESDFIGRSCKVCGHTNIVHPGSHNPAMKHCLLCELENLVRPKTCDHDYVYAQDIAGKRQCLDCGENV